MLSDLSDVSLYLQRIQSAAARCGLAYTTLGDVAGDALLLLYGSGRGAQPCRLVAAGFHGDEPAGVLAVLEFLEQCQPGGLAAGGLSFLPLVNPSGLRAGRRLNWRGEDPNRGFVCARKRPYGLSAEGEILYRHRAKLIRLAGAGFLTLHEDNDLLNEGYFYRFHQPEKGEATLSRLRERLFRKFCLLGEDDIAGARVENGVIDHYSDGSFEEFLFCRGIPVTICTETPGRAALHDRVDVNRQFIEAFVAES